MWARNLLFLSLLAAGISGLVASLLTAERIDDPDDFNPQRLQDPEFASVVDQVDREFRDYWREHDLQPAGPASELTVARRISLGLTGTIPSLEEIRELERRPAEQRIQWWVSHILADRRHADYLAERLARAYVGTENGPFLLFRRRRFVSWLSDWLQNHHRDSGQFAGYDELVRQLLADSGLWTDTPAVNFATVTIDDNEQEQPDPVSLAGRTARALLAVRIDCLQCHDDQLGNVQLGSAGDPRDGTQQDFHQLAAFFSEVRSSPRGIRDTGDQPYVYQFLNDTEETLVDPDVPYARQLRSDSGPLRQQLAQWVTHPENRPFARAIVNRIWALMFGRPLVEPIDDIPITADFTVSGEYLPGLETLADDFVDHGYDLRRLIRLIAATEVFQLDSRATFPVQQKHEKHWALFPLTRLRPEQVAGSIIQSTSLTTIDANSHVLSQLRRFFEQNDFVRRYGDFGESEFDEHAVTITQRLLMMNGELPHKRTEANAVMLSSVSQIAGLAPTDRKAVEIAYLVVLTRHPTDVELGHFANRLSNANRRQRWQELEELVRTLMNGSEFSTNH